ncbi:MAG TPA: PKD domain-containing protein, partial [Verrucomicrobiae bacterium]|nr:PKD domain-containing protein [Verrucomicrobiae bacterium]
MADPALAVAPPQISSNSPCIGAGSSAYAYGTDIFGQAWLTPPSIGCVEYIPGNVTGPISLTAVESLGKAQTNLAIDFSATISGRVLRYQWDFGDGTKITNALQVSHSWSSPGNYSVVLTAYNDSNPGGVSVTNSVQIVTYGIRYVSASSASPVSPFATWATAAAKIQDAVDVCQAGDLVIVTNGTYSQGGHLVSPSLLVNRVAITNPITVQSVNGPGMTTIQGSQVSGTTFGDSAVRCVYLTNGAALVGFTLTNGATRNAGDPVLEQSGAGVFCLSTNIVVSNCIFAGNAAYNYGGGASGGTVINSIFVGNATHGLGGGAAGGIVVASYFLNNSSSAASGGGASGATLNNCTVINNSGGGISNCVANNCIIDFNSGGSASNYDTSSVLNYCCTAPLPAIGTGNLGVNPQFAVAPYLLAASPCRGAGSSAYSIGSDLDGRLWLTPPSIGCEEYVPGTVLGPLNVALQSSLSGADTMFPINFTGSISGQYNGFSWNFGDSTVVTNQFAVTHSWSAPGNYSVVFAAFNDSNPGGVAITNVIQITPMALHYVNLLSTNPQPPFTSWDTAATNIQNAINSAFAGDTVLVSNGVYSQGGAVGPSQTLTNRVTVTIPITIQSVNGPAVTTIQGRQVPGTTNGSSAIRGVYLATGSSLIGFTVTGGATLGSSSSTVGMGGGVWCASSNVMVSNCVISGNS